MLRDNIGDFVGEAWVAFAVVSGSSGWAGFHPGSEHASRVASSSGLEGSIDQAITETRGSRSRPRTPENLGRTLYMHARSNAVDSELPNPSNHGDAIALATNIMISWYVR